MDIKQSDNFRDQNLKQLNYTGDNKYDYEKYGVLTKTLPKILFKGNSIFVTFHFIKNKKERLSALKFQ